MTQYRLAVETGEKDELFRLRYQVYCKEKQWLKESDYPDGREIDEYDPHSVHFVAIKNDKVAGTARAIFPSELGLPILNSFNVAVPAHVTSYVEISRLAVFREARGLAFTLGLLRTLSAWCLEKGITNGYAVLENDLLDFLVRLGYPFKQVGEKKYLYGNYNFPVCMALNEAIARDYHQAIPSREEEIIPILIF
jgi:N-acyl-L-homoserine lactone synthetase